MISSMGSATPGGQSGLTLIGLLVVIAVLAILAAIVIFNVTGFRRSRLRLGVRDGSHERPDG